MEFIKKNLLLVIFLSLSLIISLVLIYMVVSKHSMMKRSFMEVEKNKEEIKRLIASKPAPVKENLTKISQDIKQFEQKLIEVQGVFGFPYKEALKAFAEALGKTEAELNKEFCTFWKNEAKKGTTQHELLNKYLSKLNQEKLPAAMEAFKAKLITETVEPIDESNINDILLVALGYPRTMSDTMCKNHIYTIQTGLLKRLEKKSVLTTFITAQADTTKQKFYFGFSEYESKMPLQEEIPLIIKHCTMLEDLINRVANSGLKHLDNVVKVNGLFGEEDPKGYLRFRYSITVTGEMSTLKKFVNSLSESYKDNRIYIVKDPSIERINDEAKKLIEPQKAAAAAAGPASKETKVEEIVPGEPVLGNVSSCKATIEFDYVTFIANELKLKK